MWMWSGWQIIYTGTGYRRFYDWLLANTKTHNPAFLKNYQSFFMQMAKRYPTGLQINSHFYRNSAPKIGIHLYT